MHLYSVFGGTLRSEVDFPELRPGDAANVDWTFRQVDTLPDYPDARYLGEDQAGSKAKVRLYRHADGYRLEFDDVGSYDVSGDGTEILWRPGPDVRMSLVREDVVGRALAVVYHLRGIFCLHGSAVEIGGQGIAFLAPKYHGKSTTAQAMIDAGARLASDDTVPVDPGPPAIMHPGVHRVRLWNDSEARLVRREEDGGTPKSKNAMDAPPDGKLMFESVPLAALYLLAPVKPAPDRPAARRVHLPDIPAALSLITHAKLGPMLGKSEAPVALDRAVAIARKVPVYRLEVVRDFDRLPEVIGQVMDWHGANQQAPARVGAVAG